MAHSKRSYARCILLVSALLGGVEISLSQAQQLPPTTLAVVRNESASSISIEVQSGGAWQSVTIEPNKDTSLRGDRIRVSTTRDDKAILTVDLAIQTGKKYRVFWNAQASMWDLGGTA